MLKSVKVNIGGQEFNLRADDEEKVRHLAEQVDVKMQHLRHKIQNPSTAALTVLTALNIAEEGHDRMQQQQADISFVTRELERMSDFLESSYNADSSA